METLIFSNLFPKDSLIYLNKNLAATSKCNYLSVRDGKISYHNNPENQLIIPGLGTWAKKGRQVSSFKKIYNMLFSSDLSELNNELIESESLKISAACKKISMVKVSFKKAYSVSMEGWSQLSCMVGKDYERFYDQLPNFQAYLFKEDGQIIGRAYSVEIDSVKYMDRIYFKNEPHLKAIQKFAKKRNFFYKEYNTYGSNDYLRNNESKSKLHFDIKLDLDCHIPFIDTFCYYDSNNEVLRNYCDSDATHKFQNTDGTADEINTHEGEVQLKDGDWVSQDDVIYICDGNCEGYYYIDDCFEYNETWYHESDGYYSNILGEMIPA